MSRDGFQHFRGSATDRTHRRHVSNHARGSMANGSTSQSETMGVPARDTSEDDIIECIIHTSGGILRPRTEMENHATSENRRDLLFRAGRLTLPSRLGAHRPRNTCLIRHFKEVGRTAQQ